MTTRFKSVKIYPHESYFTSSLVVWKPFNGKSYTINLDNIFPERVKELIKKSFTEKGLNSKVLDFSYFEYDKVNKTLFLEEKSYNITPFIQNGRKWRTP